jgi:hypothetical protein
MTTLTVRSHRARRARAACLGALCVLTAQAAAAQSRASAAPSALRMSEAPRGDDEVGGWHIEQCMAGLTYGAPFKLALFIRRRFAARIVHRPRYLCAGRGQVGFWRRAGKSGCRHQLCAVGAPA